MQQQPICVMATIWKLSKMQTWATMFAKREQGVERICVLKSLRCIKPLHVRKGLRRMAIRVWQKLVRTIQIIRFQSVLPDTVVRQHLRN